MAHDTSVCTGYSVVTANTIDIQSTYMSLLATYINNSDESCRDICTFDVFIVLLLVVLHVSGTNHNHPKYRLRST